MTKKGVCPTCDGKQILDNKPCPSLSVTVLGRLACKLPDGTFDNKAEHRSILNARMQKDKAYEERNKVVAAFARHILLAHGGKAGLKRTRIAGWNPVWDGCVYIDLPNGPQISWHYHDDHAKHFEGIPAYEGSWDNHDTPEKYRRLEQWSKEWKP